MASLTLSYFLSQDAEDLFDPIAGLNGVADSFFTATPTHSWQR